VPLEKVFLAGPALGGGNRVIASPFQFAVDGTDSLRLTIISTSEAGGTVSFSGRFVSLAGEIGAFQRSVPLPLNGATRRELVSLAPGFVLNLAVVLAQGSSINASHYAQVELVRGFSGAIEILGVLAAGYVKQQYPIAWPGSAIESSTSGSGQRRWIDLAPPGVDAELEFDLPLNVLWRINGFAITLVCSAVVGSRRPVLIVEQQVQGGMVYGSPSPGFNVASETQRFYWAAGMALATEISEVAIVGGLAHDLKVYGSAWGGRIRTILSGRLAGDNFVLPSVAVDEWIAPL